MTEIIRSRRGFIAGLGALFIAAPAIVRATSIMPVKAISIEDLLRDRMDAAYEATRQAISQNLYGELTKITREAFLPGLRASIYRPSPWMLKQLVVPIEP